MTEEPAIYGNLRVQLEPLWQVILFNDDVNTMEYVVRALILTFGHSRPLAVKIMWEAHCNGRAVAEVEPEFDARRHASKLLAMGLTARVERV